MLVFKYCFFLLNVLIWSILMLRIKIRTDLKSELNGLHKNVQNFDPRYIESREMQKTKKATTLRNTPYLNDPQVKFFSVCLLLLLLQCFGILLGQDQSCLDFRLHGVMDI